MHVLLLQVESLAIESVRGRNARLYGAVRVPPVCGSADGASGGPRADVRSPSRGLEDRGNKKPGDAEAPRV
jgi:hypothetical protein